MGDYRAASAVKLRSGHKIPPGRNPSDTPAGKRYSQMSLKSESHMTCAEIGSPVKLERARVLLKVMLHRSWCWKSDAHPPYTRKTPRFSSSGIELPVKAAESRCCLKESRRTKKHRREEARKEEKPGETELPWASAPEERPGSLERLSLKLNLCWSCWTRGTLILAPWAGHRSGQRSHFPEFPRMIHYDTFLR